MGTWSVTGPAWLSQGGRAASPGPDPALLDAMARLERSLSVAAPPPLNEAASAAGCPTEGIRELERTGRIVVLDDDLAYATTTYDEITGDAPSGSPRPRRSPRRRFATRPARAAST